MFVKLMIILQMIYGIFKKTWQKQEIIFGLRKKIDVIEIIQRIHEYDTDDDELDELMSQAFAEGFCYKRTATGNFIRVY